MTGGGIRRVVYWRVGGNHMSSKHLPALVVALGFWAVPSAAQSVKVEFNNGLVTVSAQNAPVRQILAEWARLGGTTFVNGDRVPGGPVTLELENVPERHAIDVLLRSVSGYMVAARETNSVPGASTFDRILIVPTSSAPRATGPAFLPQPTPQPVQQPVVPEVEIDQVEADANRPDPDEERPANARPRTPLVPPTVNGRPMPPQPFEPDRDDEQPRPPGSTTVPNNPFGVGPGSSRPGVITPTPQQPRNGPPQPDPEP
jgi:hypothetical protein